MGNGGVCYGVTSQGSRPGRLDLEFGTAARQTRCITSLEFSVIQGGMNICNLRNVKQISASKRRQGSLVSHVATEL